MLRVTVIKRISYMACFLCFILFSCRKNSSPTPGGGTTDSTSKAVIKSVLILGNSIVWTPVRPDLGWNGNWGMAASSVDSDFVHILIRDIHQKDSNVTIRYQNIADFEVNFTIYPLSNLDSLRNPDMLILRISENVNDQKAADSNFYKYYSNLVSYLTPRDSSVRVITDGFWPKNHVNTIIRNYATDSNYIYVENTDLYSDSTNASWGIYSNPGVAMHPSDKGMRYIAGRIWDKIESYF